MRTALSALILAAITGLCCYSLVFIQSASGSGEGLMSGDLSSQLKKQLISCGLGLMAMLWLVYTPPRSMQRHAFILFVLNILLLGLVLVIGHVAGGACSWLPLGPVQVQPSELMKVTWLLFMASLLRQRQRYRDFWKLLWGPCLFTGIPLLLILIQPDMGTASIFIFSLFVLLYLVGARLRHLALLALILCLATCAGWFFVLKDYQKNRLRSFVNPSKYEHDFAWQLNSSLLAIGDGYWFGKGVGQGEVNRLALLPERHTDFIFAVICEETGLVGALGLMACYAILILSCLLLGDTTREPFSKNLVLGAATIIGVQTCVNLGVVLGLLPTTGLTLPFISFGGSSFIASCLLAGIALSVARHKSPELSGDAYNE